MAAASGFKPCSLKLGGKNAMIIMDDANLDLAGRRRALGGAFGTTGQRCTATSRILIHKKIARRFTEQLVERARKLRIGNGLEKGIASGPQVSQQQLETSAMYVKIAIDEGAKLLTGGKRLQGKAYADGYFLRSHHFWRSRADHGNAHEEVFGPVLSLLEFDTFERALQIANDVDYGLSGRHLSRDVNQAYRAMRDIETGIIASNAPTIGAEVHLPFGGIKKTGNGHREEKAAVAHWISTPPGSLSRVGLFRSPATRPDRYRRMTLHFILLY